MAKTITGKSKITRSTSSPSAPGGKVVGMTASKNSKSANNSTNRTATPKSSSKK